jgi:hypothetical protein
MRSFWESVFFGTLAGGGPIALPMALLAVGMLFSDRNYFGAIYAIVLPFLVAFPLVLGSSIVAGLPVTFFLKWKGWENASTYIFAGVTIGALVPIAILVIGDAESGYPLALLGALSGGVTARTWWVSGREPHIIYDN